MFPPKPVQGLSCQATRHKIQLTIGSRDREDAEEEAQPGWIAWGGVVPSLGVTKWNDEKKQRDGRGLGLRRMPMMIFHTTTNQK